MRVPRTALSFWVQGSLARMNVEIALSLWFSGSLTGMSVETITKITIYLIHPSGKLKVSFDRTTKNISQ